MNQEPQRLDLDRTYTSSDLVRYAGISYRQIQWWDEQGVVRARQEGHRRLYTPAEALEIRIIAELRRKGLSLQRLRSVLRALRHELNRILQPALVENRDFYLLTDGRIVRVVEDPGRAFEALKRTTIRRPFVTIAISEHTRI